MSPKSSPGSYRFGQIPPSDPPEAKPRPEEVGRFTLSIPTVIATALITALTTITCTWMSMRHAPPDNVEQQIANCLTKDDFNESMRQRDAREQEWRAQIGSDLSQVKAAMFSRALGTPPPTVSNTALSVGVSAALGGK